MKNTCNGKKFISTSMADNKRIVLIGAGNVATHLGLALKRNGHEIMQIYSRTEVSASALSERLGAPFTTSMDEVFPGADIYVVSVKDAVLQDLLPSVVKGRKGALFVHTAGSIPMDVWKGVTNSYGGLYPMQTFSKSREVDFNTVSFFVEALEKDDLQMLVDLASSLTPKVYKATSEQRMSLHVAAVFACNFTNHMYALSAGLLEKYGMPFDAMLPLIDETARKVHGLAPREAQTGPAVRRDENVMGKHAAMLADEPRLQELYRMISQSIQES